MAPTLRLLAGAGRPEWAGVPIEVVSESRMGCEPTILSVVENGGLVIRNVVGWHPPYACFWGEGLAGTDRTKPL